MLITIFLPSRFAGYDFVIADSGGELVSIHSPKSVPNCRSSSFLAAGNIPCPSSTTVRFVNRGVPFSKLSLHQSCGSLLKRVLYVVTVISAEIAAT